MTHEYYKPIVSQHPVAPCPLCGSAAELYQHTPAPDANVQRVVMCSRREGVVPRDDAVCVLYMPPDDFYRPTARDAIKYWNDHADTCARLKSEAEKKE